MPSVNVRVVLLIVVASVLFALQLFLIPPMASASNTVLSVSGFVLAIINAVIITTIVVRVIKLTVRREK